MVAQRDEDARVYCKSVRLDLGIEESIRRCEALLAVSHISFQPNLGERECGLSSVSKKDGTVVDIGKKQDVLKPEWNKNMGLLKGVKSTNSMIDDFETQSSEMLPTRVMTYLEKFEENGQTSGQTEPPTMLKPEDIALVQDASQQANNVTMPGGSRGSEDENCSKKIHVKRDRTRSQGSSASENWTVNFSEAAQSLSSAEKENDKKMLIASGGGSQLKDAAEHISVPSCTTTATSSEECHVDEVITINQPLSINSDTSSSYRSFETLCFTFTTPKHCEEAWEWFDKQSVDSKLPESTCEGLVHEAHQPPRQNQMENFMHSQWKLEERMLRGGRTTNFRRSKSTLAKERLLNPPPNAIGGQRDPYGQGEARSILRRENTLCTTDRKVRPHAAAAKLKATLRRLAKPRTALYQRYAQTKALREEEQLSECSFKPVVGRRPDPSSPLALPIFDRIGEMKQRIDLRKRARKLIEKEELEQCSFWPQINLSSSVYVHMDPYQPIQERLQELLKKRHERVAQARAQEAKSKGLTFKPSINQNSIRLFKQKGLETIKVSDRLTSYSLSQCDDQCRGRRNKPNNECTFAPEINPNTDEILAGSQLEGCSFLTRQQAILRRLEERKKNRKLEVPPDHTFQPNIGNASLILQFSPLKDGNEETLDERLERLSLEDCRRRSYIRQRISDNYYSQFKFQPEIDQTSRSLVGSSDLSELHLNERGKRTKEALQRAAEEEFIQTCTFHPIVNACKRPTRHTQSVIQSRRKFRQDKAKNLEQLRVQMEMQEFKECTFKPDVNRLLPKDKEPVHIKGLGRHLELQDLAKQMKKEQEEVERKVFITHVCDLPKRQYTIPKPFVLHSGRSSDKLTVRKPDLNRNKQAP